PRLAHDNRTNATHDLALGQMPVTHHAPAARLGLEIAMSVQKVSDLRLDRLRQQGACPTAQNLGERIDEGPWLRELDDVIVGHGVSLLQWRSGGVEHPHDTPPYPFMPSPTSAHSSLPGTNYSVGGAINASGQVAGFTLLNGGFVATEWNGTTPTALGTLPGTANAYGLDINNSGEVVGYTLLLNGTYQATVWDNAFTIALEVLPGGSTNFASAINDAGQIAGYSQTYGGHYDAVLWSVATPVSATPLPAALPLFATGLGVLGLLGWRRKRKNAAA